MHEGLLQTMHEKNDYWISAYPAEPEDVRVTVIIPAFNAADTLARAIGSALTQSLREVEVIVVDDASHDESWDIVLDWLQRDARLRAVRNKHNRGKSVGMNRAIAMARGQWLAVLDADDWYHRDRLATLLDVAEFWHADIVADNQHFYDSGARRTIGPAWPPGGGSWSLDFDDFLAGANAYDTFNFGMLKPIVRKAFLERTDLTYEKRARNGQDFFYLLQFFLRGGRAAVSDRPMYFYTQPFGAVSRRWSHASRRRYDFQLAHDINQSHLPAVAKEATGRQVRRVKSRNRRLQALEYYYASKDAFQQRRVATAISIFLRHPGILNYAFRRFLARHFEHWKTPTAARIARRCRRRIA